MKVEVEPAGKTQDGEWHQFSSVETGKTVAFSQEIDIISLPHNERGRAVELANDVCIGIFVLTGQKTSSEIIYNKQSIKVFEYDTIDDIRHFVESYINKQ